jgi:hypothetical protein
MSETKLHFQGRLNKFFALAIDRQILVYCRSRTYAGHSCSVPLLSSRSLRETPSRLRFRSGGMFAVCGSSSRTARPRVKPGETKGREGRSPLPSSSYLFSPSGAGRSASALLGLRAIRRGARSRLRRCAPVLWHTRCCGSAPLPQPLPRGEGSLGPSASPFALRPLREPLWPPPPPSSRLRVFA